MRFGRGSYSYRLPSEHEVRRRRTWIAVSVLLALAATSSSTAYARADVKEEALEAAWLAATKATSVDDLIAFANQGDRSPFVTEGLSYGAAFASWDPQFPNRSGLQQSAIKAMVLATLLELRRDPSRPGWPADEGLWSFGPASLRALKRHLPQGTRLEGREAFLRRQPTWRPKPWDGEYQYRRFDVLHKRFVFERMDVEALGLGPALELTEVTQRKGKDDALPVNGLTYSFPLNTINEFVIAGKALLCLGLLAKDSPNARYAKIVAGNSFYYASMAEGTGHSATNLARFAEPFLAEGVADLERCPNPQGNLLTAPSLQPRLTAVRFFGRNMRGALRDYERAASDVSRERLFRLYGRRGQAICELAVDEEEKAQQHFRLLITSIDQKPELADSRYVCIALIDAIGDDVILGSKPFSLMIAAQIADWRGEKFDEYDRYRMNLDLLRVLWTINRPRAAVELLMRELSRLDAEAGRDPGLLHLSEKDYMRELGVFLGDVFAELSWDVDLSKRGLTRPRHPREEWRRMFAPTLLDKLGRGSSRPYGSLSPEEDRATCFELYKPVTGPLIIAEMRRVGMEIGLEKLIPEGDADIAGAFREWVAAELNNSNTVPLLKLVWVEWFFLPLAELRNPDFDPKAWSYRPLTRSGLTSPSAVQSALERSRGVDPRIQAVAGSFLRVRQFLDRRYPPR